MTNNEKAAQRVASAIAKGRVVKAYNVLHRQETSVGPYHEAVDRGYSFAVFGYGGPHGGFEETFRTATQAAREFVRRVGSTRAREAAIKVGGTVSVPTRHGRASRSYTSRTSTARSRGRRSR